MNEFKEKMLNVLNTYLFNEETQVEEVAPVVEEVVETPAPEATETFAEQAPVEVEVEAEPVVEYVTPEQLAEALQVIVEQLTQLSTRIDEMTGKVEEFGKQSLSTPTKESVETFTLTTKSPYERF